MNAFKIGFIGLGLIGGSVAKSIHRIFPNYTIIGYDVNTVTLKEAQADGTLDHYTTKSATSQTVIMSFCVRRFIII